MRTRRNASESETPVAVSATDTAAVAHPIGGADFRAIMAKLDAVLMEQHELRRLVHRMAVPVETVSLREAARRLTRSTKWVKNIQCRSVFTDGRPPELRVAGAALVFYADEIDVYRTDGEVGVARLRRNLGRN